MMMTESTPRLTAQYLEQFSGQVVMLVGTVSQLRGETAVFSSGGEITLNLTRDSHLRMGAAFEIIGKVNPDLSVKVMSATDLGEGVDTNAYAAVVDATLRLKDIFYGES